MKGPIESDDLPAVQEVDTRDADDLATALRVLRDHDMLEEAEMLTVRAASVVTTETGAKVIDLMAALKASLSLRLPVAPPPNDDKGGTTDGE